MNRKQRRALAYADRKVVHNKKGNAAIAQTTTASAEPSLSSSTQPQSFAVAHPGYPFPAIESLSPANPQIVRSASPAQMAANRANAQLSSGAKTQAGHEASSQNRTTHGLARHNGAFRLLTSEDPTAFADLKNALAAEYSPKTVTESILVNAMAESHWLANRSQTLQDSVTDQATGQITDTKMAALYLRYHTTHTRAFHKALNTLLKLRKENRTAEIGFEAQKRKTEELRIKNEKHEMKKQTHYWDVMRKDGEATNRLALNLMQRAGASRENPNFDAEFQAELAKRGLSEVQFGLAAV